MAAAAPQHKAWRMLNRIFPRQFDNDHRGHWLGIALFILVIALKAMQGVNSIIMTHQVMTTADGIPVDSYGPAAAAAAMSMFALLGMYVLVIALKAMQGVNSIIMTHQVMTTADGIPVDSYGPAAAAAAMSIFALLGMYLLVLPIIG